jgi:TP901 family phage tail tape measure protein
MANFSIAFIYEAIDKVTAIQEKIKRNQKKTFDAMGASMDKFNRKLDATGKKLKSIGGGITSVGKSITTRVTLPLLAMGAMAIVQGGRFEDAMASLSAITGVTGKQLSVMRGEIMQSGERFGIDSAAFAKGMELIGSKKPELLKMPIVLKGVTDAAALMAKAAGQELPEAALNLTETMNQFNISGERASEVVNILAAGSKFGAVAIPQLSQSINLAGVAAKNAKLSLAETVGTIEILGERGLSGARAGTQLRNVFTILEAQASKKFKPSVVGLAKALENLDKAQISTAQTVKLFGRENLNAASILIEGRKRIGEMAAKVVGTNTAVEQARIRMATLNQQLAKLWVFIKNQLIKIFIAFGPQIKKVAAFTGMVLAKIATWVKANPKLASTLAVVVGVFGVLGPLLVGLGAVVGTVGTAISFLAGIFTIAVAKAVAVGAAITAVTAGMIFFGSGASESTTWSERLRMVWEFLKKAGIAIWNDVGPVFNNLKAIVLELFAIFKNSFWPILKPILGGAFKVALGALVLQFKAWIGYLNVVSEIFLGIVGYIREIMESDIAKNIVSAISETAEGVSAFIGEDLLGDTSRKEALAAAINIPPLPVAQSNLNADITLRAEQGTEIVSAQSSLIGEGNVGFNTIGQE